MNPTMKLTAAEEKWLTESTEVVDWEIVTDPNKITPETALELLGCIASSGPHKTARGPEGDQLIRRLAAFVALNLDR